MIETKRERGGGRTIDDLIMIDCPLNLWKSERERWGELHRDIIKVA